MARPLSNEKRKAILNAAVELFAQDGLGASTAKIAKSAKVAEGTIFIYFQTKTRLINELYLDLKKQLHASLEPLAHGVDAREQLWNAWRCFTSWGVAHQKHQHVLSQINLSSQLSSSTRDEADHMFCEVNDLLKHICLNHELDDFKNSFPALLMGSMAEATMAVMRIDPHTSRASCKAGFDAFWRAIVS